VVERIRANAFLRLIFTIVAGIAAGAFFIGIVLLVIIVVGLFVGGGK
jgi:hypothetical protein